MGLGGPGVFNDYDSFSSGLVGGENEPIDRVFTGDIFELTNKL